VRSLAIVALFAYAFVGALTSAAQDLSRSESGVTYELYSWRGNGHDWNFCILETTSRMKTPDEIFKQQRLISTVGGLKKRIAHLPKSSRIVWIKNFVFEGKPIPGTEKLELPSKEIIDDIKQYAAPRGIEISGAE
jgi:hypothetical protein